MIQKKMYPLIGLALLGIPVVAFLISFFWGLRDIQSPNSSMKKLSAQTKIVNAHEHIQSYTNVPKFLKAMKKIGVEKTLIVGSPEATILKDRKGFYGEEKYNLEALKIGNTYPDDFIVFPTIDWKDPEKLTKFKKYMEMGGQGLKLYNGHTYFDEGYTLDDPSMMELYAYCEKNNIPILYHVNIGHMKFRVPFEKILKTYPRLKVICPHFCLSTIKSERFEYMMNTYPNLYTDLSFGFIEFLTPALKRISKNPDKFRRLLTKYQDRFFYGTDTVVTSASYKTPEWFMDVGLAYRNMLELETYEFSALPGKTLKGLSLPKAVLDKVYYQNFEYFMSYDPR